MKITACYTELAEAELKQIAKHSREAAEDAADIVVIVSHCGLGRTEILEKLAAEGRWIELSHVETTINYYLYGPNRVVRATAVMKRLKTSLFTFTLTSVELVD